MGCPAYVLDPTLQDGQKIPKWKPRSRVGQYMGLSPLHASTVGVVRNLKTGRLSPQFHVVYDDKFETVSTDFESQPLHWEELLITSSFKSDFCGEEDPELETEWLDDETSLNLNPSEIVDCDPETDAVVFGRVEGATLLLEQIKKWEEEDEN